MLNTDIFYLNQNHYYFVFDLNEKHLISLWQIYNFNTKLYNCLVTLIEIVLVLCLFWSIAHKQSALSKYEYESTMVKQYHIGFKSVYYEAV